MGKYSYTTEGTCSRQILFELDGDVVKEVRFIGGCPGNLIGISQLAQGRRVDEVITLLKGIQCRNGTSCPDQFAKALESINQPECGQVG